MEARVRTALPDGAWAFEPKWDGFRAVVWGPPHWRLDSRNRRPLLRYFPELEEAVAALPSGTVVDGEVVVVTDGHLDFGALQLRLHPARSRNLTLAAAHPAQLVGFDLLADRGEDLRGAPFAQRRGRLEALVADLSPPWRLTPSTTDRDEATRWFDEYAAAGCDGIVAKRLDGAYVEGERAMVKVKHRWTVDTVVLGYRLHTAGDRVGSLLLGLSDGDGGYVPVGHCVGFPDEERVRLLDLLQRFHVDGVASRTGEASRWSGDKDMTWYEVVPGLVVEVSYDQLAGPRFRHTTRFERWRPDKDARACGLDQLVRPDGPPFETIFA